MNLEKNVVEDVHLGWVVSDRNWVESVTGGIVTRFDRTMGGGSRITFVVDVKMPDSSTRELVLQRMGFGPYSFSDIIRPDHEHAIIDELADTQVLVPQLVGISPDGMATLVTREPGSNQFNALTDPVQKRELQRDYIRQLAALHNLDPRTMPDLGIPIPKDPKACALFFANKWGGMMESQTRRPFPVARLAVRWLEANAPVHEDRPVICHGDTGPGNFLFKDHSVTCLTDWELVHICDRHADLGSLVLRGYQLGQMKDLQADMDYYQSLTGVQPRLDVLTYYRIAALTSGLVTTRVQLDLEAPGRLSYPWYLFLSPMLSNFICQALAQAMGVELREPEEIAAVVNESELQVIDAIAEKLPALRPDIGSPGVPGLLDHLRLYIRYGENVRAAEFEDISQVLGFRPDTPESGEAELERRLASGQITDAELLQWCYRSARRQCVLWPTVTNMDLVPIELRSIAEA